MKYLFLLALSILIFSCSSGVDLHLDQFNSSHEKAFQSQFKIVDDKIYRIGEDKAFSGKISTLLNNTLESESIVKDGDFENIKVYYDGNIGLEVNKKGQTLTSQNYPIKDSQIVSEMKCNFTNVTNASLISLDLNKLEGTCEMRLPVDKMVVNSQSKKESGIIIKESVAKNTEDQRVLFKEIIFTKILSDNAYVIANLTENHEETVLTRHQPFYREEIQINKSGQSALFSMAVEKEGNITLHSNLNKFDGKECSEAESMHLEGLYMPAGEKESYEIVPCVSDGLKIVNEALKKNITREDLRNRIDKKKGNNLYLTRNPEDISFYF